MNSKARLTPQMLKLVPHERDVVSFSPGVDRQTQIVLFKFALRNGKHDVIFLPAALAIFLRDRIRESARRSRWKDHRRRNGDTRPEIAAVREFLSGQPSLKTSDWDAMAEQRPHQAISLEVHVFQDALFIAFNLGADTYQIFRFSPALSFYLGEMIDDAEKNAPLHDLVNSPPESQAIN